jgi:hypothetical protein
MDASVTSAIFSACNPWAFGSCKVESDASPVSYARMASYVHRGYLAGVASDADSQGRTWGAAHASYDVPRECTDMRNVTR